MKMTSTHSFSAKAEAEQNCTRATALQESNASYINSFESLKRSAARSAFPVSPTGSKVWAPCIDRCSGSTLPDICNRAWMTERVW